MNSLDEWNAQFSNVDDLNEPSTATRFEFSFDCTYVCKVTQARALRSSIGSRQIELSLDVMAGDDVVGTAKEWVTLPMQPETDAKLNRDTVIKLTKRRRDDIRNLLLCVDPERYGIPSSCKGEAWATAAVAVNRLVMQVCEQIHRDIEQDGTSPLPEWSDVTVYLVKAANKRKPEYPYTNWFASPKKGVPVFGQGGINF